MVNNFDNLAHSLAQEFAERAPTESHETSGLAPSELHTAPAGASTLFNNRPAHQQRLASPTSDMYTDSSTTLPGDAGANSDMEREKDEPRVISRREGKSEISRLLCAH